MQHLQPMLSLDNTYSQEELREFVNRVQRLLPDETLDWIVEPKIDGVAINLRYEQGVFTCGSTRGDGTDRRRHHRQPAGRSAASRPRLQRQGAA